MADNNTERIDDIVDPKVLQQLSALDLELDKTYDQMVKMLGKTIEVEKSLSSIATKYKDLVDAISKYESIQRRTNSTQSEQDRILRQQEQLRQRIANAYSEESLELVRLQQLMQQITRTRRNLVQEQNAQTGSTVQLRAQLNLMIQSWDAMGQRTRRSPIGQQVHQDIQRLTEEITRLESATGRNQRNVGNYLDRIGSAISVFAGNLLTKATEGLQQLISKGVEFVKVGIEMAAKAEGITTAFNKLNQPDLLSNLQKETKGTINNLLLMQSAVKARNFQIPLESLGSYLKFAQQRAQETGESIEYLTESIINGIGRKSPLILDNLGISGARLRQEMADGADIIVATTKIVNEELEKQGTLTLTAADRSQQASVKWENSQQKLGEKLLWLKDILSEVKSSSAEMFDDLIDNKLPALGKRIEDTGNRIIDLYNSMGSLRIAFQLLIAIGLAFSDTLKYLGKQVVYTFKNVLDITLDSFKIVGDVIDGIKNGFNFDIDTSKIRKSFANLGNDIVDGSVDLWEKTKENFEKAVNPDIKIKPIDFFRESGGGVISPKIDEKPITTFNEQIEVAKKNVADLKKGLEDLRSGKTESSDYAKDIEEQAKSLKEAEDKLSYLLTGGSSKDNAKAEKDAKKSAEEMKKLAEAELKASHALEEFEAKQAAEANKKIIDDNKKAYNERLTNLDQFLEKQKASIEVSRKNQIESLKKSEMTEKAYADSITLINEKAQAEVNKITEEGAKIKLSIEKDNVDKQLKVISQRTSTRIKELEKGESEELLELTKSYANKEISSKEYEIKRLALTKKSATDRMDIQIEEAKNAANVANLTEEQRDDLNKKLGDARIDYEKYVNEELLANERKTADARLDIEKQLAEKRKELIAESLELISTLFAANSEKQIAKLDKESEANSKYYQDEQEKVERLAEAGAITAEQADARKAYLAEQEEKREADLEEKRKEILQRQAKFEKAMAATRVIIDTASAVMKITAQLGVLAAPLIPAIIATGAIQLATILATPIPQYAKGTDNHKGGPAIVGDGGKHELVITPDGSMYKTPNTDTLVNLPANSQVLPDYNKAIENLVLSRMIMPIEDNKTIIIQENKKQIGLAQTSNSLLGKMIKGQNKLRNDIVYANSSSSIRFSGRA